MNKLSVLILASRPVGQGQFFSGKLDSPLLIPFRGKPLVVHLENQFQDFNIVYACHEDASKTISFMQKRYNKRELITVPKCISNRTTGDCLLYCLDQLNFPENILTVHGDNIYGFKDYPLEVENNINYTFQTTTFNENYTYYSFISKQNGIVAEQSEYWINTGAHFIRNTKQIDRSRGVSIDSLLKDADFHVLDDWVDLGHWNLNNRHNISLNTRSFNSILMSSDKSSIKKTSANSKIVSEFVHLANIPDQFSFLFPRVRSLHETNGYEIEYWPLKSLSEYLVFWNLDFSSWIKIFERLFDLVKRFANHDVDFIDSKEKHYNLYVKILDERIKLYSKACSDILSYEFIFLNELKLQGFYRFSKELYADLERIGERISPSFYHGDLCFGNVLYDPESTLIKLIDPKGSLFEGSSNCGDFRYDLAKIFHSVIGGFDYFHWQMFSFSQMENKFEIVLFKQNNSDALENQFRKLFVEFYSKEIYRDVQILTAMLFFNMVPLHSDSSERQRAFLIQGITLLNQIYMD